MKRWGIGSELQGAPETVRQRLEGVPARHQVVLAVAPKARALATTYLERGIVGQAPVRMPSTWPWSRLGE